MEEIWSEIRILVWKSDYRNPLDKQNKIEGIKKTTLHKCGLKYEIKARGKVLEVFPSALIKFSSRITFCGLRCRGDKYKSLTWKPQWTTRPLQRFFCGMAATIIMKSSNWMKCFWRGSKGRLFFFYGGEKYVLGWINTQIWMCIDS